MSFSNLPFVSEPQFPIPPRGSSPLTIKEAAELLGWSYATTLRHFSAVDGVIRLHRPETRNKRKYESIRIPLPIFEREYKRVTTRPLMTARSVKKR